MYCKMHVEATDDANAFLSVEKRHFKHQSLEDFTFDRIFIVFCDFSVKCCGLFCVQ